MRLFFNVDVLYQTRRVTLEDGTFMYCLWIAKDTIDIDKKYGTLTLATSDEGGGAKNESLGEV